jgi:hypothetical protein
MPTRAPAKKSAGAAIVAKRELAPALAKRAKSLHDQRRQRLAAAGFEAIESITERRRQVTGAYLDIGKALAVLKQDGMPDALGCADFDDLCRKHLDMSAVRANLLVDLTERFSRAIALGLGFERAAAMLALADATPEDDSPEDLLHARLALPSGAILVVEDASTEAIYAAAKELRQARYDGGAAPDKGGRTTTKPEREAFRALSRRVAADARFAEVKLAHVARGKSKGAVIRAQVPQALWDVFVRAMAKRG